jgi:hypothetical protein
MKHIDAFNGDADGIIARHQWRLIHPMDATECFVITGMKRDVSLLAKVGQETDLEINVFDIGFDANIESVKQLLAQGATLRYFDHHRANTLFAHANLITHIDTSSDICTSLIVDRVIDGRYRHWAIAAAFGDNLIAVATSLARNAHLDERQIAQLRSLGESINYNAYGETIDDLYIHPEKLAQRIAPYTDPFQFITDESIASELAAGFSRDCALAQGTPAMHESTHVALYVLPDAAWARRVSGVFANQLADANPERAHAVLTQRAGNNNYTVSIRAPTSLPCGADEVAMAFPTGGGRKRAAGINLLPAGDLDKLIEKMTAVWAQ